MSTGMNGDKRTSVDKKGRMDERWWTSDGSWQTLNETVMDNDEWQWMTIDNNSDRR
jgi:hypothetical protein